jgi:membrane fusion protein, multidrug efflux system
MRRWSKNMSNAQNMKNMPNMPTAGLFITKFAITFIAIGLLAACTKPAPAPEPIRAVKVLTVGESALVASSEYSGEVRSRVESRLSFRVAGKIVKRQAEVGMRVRAGQILAQLDPQDYKLAGDAAKAQVAAAQTNRDLAAADFKRFQALKDQGFISGAELERRETALKAAQAQLEQAQVQVANTGNQVGYANLLADVSGIVTAVDAEPGQVVAAGTPVLRIAQDGVRDVVIAVPEDKLSSLAAGTLAKVRRWESGTGVPSDHATFNARVREVAATADPLTRTYQAKLSLEPGAALPLGATVYVQPPSVSAGASAMKLPTSALMQSAAGSTQVWLLDKASMTVKPSKVEVATADGNEAVIASGLKAGDTVVLTGAHVLAPGQKVSLYQEKGSKADKSTDAGGLIEKSATKNVANSELSTLTPAPASAK